MSKERLILQTLSLAQKGHGKTATNPLVGAILTQNVDGVETIIGRGYHKGYGKAHAEVEAIRNAHRRGFPDLSRTTLYVNLEPCCHQGKTPPCTDLILKEKIPHIVVGTADPFRRVAGNGIRILRSNGVQVDSGFLESECRELNRVFFKHVKTGLPWITLKIAQSLDGKIATLNGDSKWISSEKSRQQVHRLRSQHDAVLVGANTIIRDNPSLNVRLAKGRSPLRILLDGRLRAPLTARIFNDTMSDRTIVLTCKGANSRKIDLLRKKRVTVHEFRTNRNTINLKEALKKLLKEEKIASILVEGGGKTFGQFMRLADELIVFIAPKIIGDGVASVAGLLTTKMSQCMTFKTHTYKRLESDIVFHAILRT